MIAEVERIPFDMPEAEAELVEGWWTEYGGIRWGSDVLGRIHASYAAMHTRTLLGRLGGTLPTYTF